MNLRRDHQSCTKNDEGEEYIQRCDAECKEREIERVRERERERERER